ncbi:phage tail protein [Pseudomonas sp. NPDC086581]|uniref:phage tail-collar fiber domain-containing protein n=1 Tax=Pseudomonas sp. NPDC086581 TaxID=3364432 RepID=UPI0037F69DAB
MAYKSLHTLKGLSALARAEAMRVPINLTHMAVGDGNGISTTPSESASALVRERYRAPINRVFQSPTDARRFTAELVVPAGVGGFTLREVGVFDSNGTLFAVGNLPETYKPTAEEGAFADVTVKLDFAVSNAEVVNLQVDPNTAVATQMWITTNITAAQIIPGGTVTQVLGKASNADGDYEWKDLGEINVTVDTIAEKQLLAAGQTTVDLAVTTTYGLAVYIEGLRKDRGFGADEWEADPQSSTRLKLGKSWPANTRITLVNNEPAGSAAAPLERANNLSDVIDPAKARANLDVYSRAEIRERLAPGDIVYRATNKVPAGFLKANGAAVSRTAYADLFAEIGTLFGDGDGFSTFNVPDLRGEFVRGWDDARGVDGGRALGTGQSASIQSHAHSGSVADAGSHNHSGTANAGGAHNHAASSAASGYHAHAAWTDVQGHHGHGAWTDAQGTHDHGFRYADNGAGAVIGSDNSGTEYVHQEIQVGKNKDNRSIRTDFQGAHSHNVGIAGAGEHAHNVGIGAAGEHAHGIAVGNSGEHGHPLSIQNNGTHSHAITINATGIDETRPRNIALLACIRY